MAYIVANAFNNFIPTVKHKQKNQRQNKNKQTNKQKTNQAKR